MVSGPEHYVLAEELIGYVKEDGNLGPGDRMSPEARRDLIALAQAHATLAHAAATADLFALYGQAGEKSREAWRKAVGATAAGTEKGNA